MRLFYTLSLVLILFSACKVGKEYQAPEMVLPDQLTTVQGNDSISLSDIEWYQLFEDTVLIQFINVALENNKDMKMAAARIRRMMASKRIAASALYPELAVGGQSYTEKEHYSDVDAESRLRAELSWELDLWGNIRWGKEAAMADYLSSVEAQRAVKMSLIASVAQTYFELSAAERELKIVIETGRAREEGVALAKLRFEGGLTSETSLKQAEVEHAKTMTLIPRVENTIVIKQNQMALLLGRMPEEFEVYSNVHSHVFEDTIPVGIPSYILQRRPDIRMSEQALIAANANVGIALTNRFPKISLTARYGLQSESLGDLLTNPYSYLAGDLLAPVFNAGANKAKMKASQAEFDELYYAYEKTVLEAFQETNNSITTFYKIKEVLQLTMKLESSSRNYLDLAKLQYINGVINYLDVLDAQRLLFDAELSLNDAYRDEMVAYVLVYKTLGGGW